MKTLNQVHRALPIAVVAALASCGGGGPATGTMRLSLTDAPACGYDNVWVTVKKVRVHQSGSAGDGDAGWSEVVLATPQRIDLLTLTNGTLLPLGQTELTAGAYTQMRLVLDDLPPPGSLAGTLANSIKPTGGVETELTTPSGQQSGLKMSVNIEVPAGQVADFAIDFDACKSFVKAGSSGQYILKPVLSVIPILSSKIVGWVEPAMAASGVATTVSAQVGGVPVKSTLPGTDGRFELFPIRTGTYDLVITSSGRVNAVMTGVPVTSAGATTVGSTTVRLAPPASAASAVASGTVTVNGTSSNTNGSVRAVQSLSGGTKMEVGHANADGTTGAYSLRLPTAAPASVAYAASAAAFTFTSDLQATAGQYRLEATTTTVTTPLVYDLDLNVGTTVPTFAFP